MLLALFRSCRRCLLLPALAMASLASASAASLYVSYVGGQIGRYDSTTGENLGFFATGLDSPRGIVFDPLGNLYVANVNSATINKITPDGTVSVFASGGGLDFPFALTIDGEGILYASNLGNNTISRIAPNGTVSLFASGMNRAHGLAFASDGNLYASNYEDATLLRIDPLGNTSLLAVGNGMSNPVGIVSVGDSLFVANARNDSISRVSFDGDVEVFASASGLSFPVGLTADASGNLYAANFGGYTISRITPSGAVSQFAFTTDGGPSGLAFAPSALPPAQVPEPGTTALALVGAFACSLIIRPRRR